MDVITPIIFLLRLLLIVTWEIRETMNPQDLSLVLSQTLAPVPEQIRSAEAQLRELTENSPHFGPDLLVITARHLPTALGDGIQQAAAIALKNYLMKEWRVPCQCRLWRGRLLTLGEFGAVRDWTRGVVLQNEDDLTDIVNQWDDLKTVVGWVPSASLHEFYYDGKIGGVAKERCLISDEVKSHFQQSLIPAILSANRNYVVRELIICLKPLVCDKRMFGSMLQIILTNLLDRCRGGKSEETRITALVRCLKLPILTAWRFRDDTHVMDGLKQAVALLHQLLSVCVEHSMISLAKAVSQVALLTVKESGFGIGCDVVLDHWKEGEVWPSLLSSILAIIRDVPGTDSDDEAVLKWKTKTRLLKFFRYAATHCIIQSLESVENQPDTTQLDQATLRFTSELKRAYVVILESAVELFSQREAISQASEEVEQAFEAFVAAVLGLMTTPEFIDASVRDAFFIPQGERLLSAVLFPFLCINSTDITLIEDNPEEYSNRNSREMDVTTQDLKSDEFFDALLDCTSRGAAMLAIRDLVTMERSALLDPYIQFLGDKLSHLDFSVTESISVCVGAMRALVPTVADLLPNTAPKSETTILDIIQRLVIPAGEVSDDITMAPHLRCVACSVLGHLWDFLADRHQQPAFLTAIQLIMTRLGDDDEAVRKHAYAALFELVKSGPDQTPLQEVAAQLAPTCLKWLVLLLDTESNYHNEVLKALCTFLNLFPSKLGELDSTTDPNFHNPVKRRASVLEAHSDLLRRLSSKFFEIVQAPSPSDSDQLAQHERRLASLIETIHATTMSAPREIVRVVGEDGSEQLTESSTISNECLPNLLPFCTTILSPSALDTASKYYVHIDAFDTFETLPHENEMVVSALLPQLLELFKHSPQYVELLVGSVCQFVHCSGSKYIFQDSGRDLFFNAVSSCFLNGTTCNQCHAADLVRSLGLASCCSDGMVLVQKWGSAPPLPSVFVRMNETVSPLARQFREPFVNIMLHYLSKSVLVQPTSTVEEQLPIRLMCALCALLYADPKSIWPQLNSAKFEQGTGRQLFDGFWRTHAMHVSSKRELDAQICLLAVVTAIYAEVNSNGSADFPWALMEGAFILFEKALAVDVSDLQSEFDEEYSLDPDDQVRDLEAFPNLIYCIGDNAIDAFVQLVMSTFGNNPSKAIQLQEAVGAKRWAIFQAFISENDSDEIVHF